MPFDPHQAWRTPLAELRHAFERERTCLQAFLQHQPLSTFAIEDNGPGLRPSLQRFEDTACAHFLSETALLQEGAHLSSGHIGIWYDEHNHLLEELHELTQTVKHHARKTDYATGLFHFIHRFESLIFLESHILFPRLKRQCQKTGPGPFIISD